MKRLTETKLVLIVRETRLEELKGVAQQEGDRVVAGLGGIGRREGGGARRRGLEFGDEGGGVLFRAAKRAQAQEGSGRPGLDDPLAITGADKGARSKGGGGGWV